MKKILLTVSMIASFAMIVNSQTVLNEVYTDPGNGKTEFIELYNSSTGTQDVDCFTIMTFWESGNGGSYKKGWYVIDLPSYIVASKGWFTISAASPFNVQNQVGVSASANWNSLPASGYIKKYELSGSSYTDVTAGPYTDILVGTSPTGANGTNYYTLLFQNGVMINGFVGGGANGALPSGITSMPDLTITPVGACVTPFVVDFSALGAIEYVNQSPGSDNGYARKSDGKCGAWDKTAPGVSHTPNVSNGSAAGAAGALTTTELINCGILLNGSYINRVTFDITAISGSATELDDFPVEVRLYYDYTPSVSPPGYLRQPNGILDGVDSTSSALVTTFATVAETSKFFDIKQTAYVILVYKTKRGCFDKVVPVVNGCAPLPVDFKSFTATRNRSSVLLRWETSSEINNSGFAVERNMNGTWEQIAFVNSQAANGNSEALLTYTYSDMNNAKGITQYRIKQVDFDNKSKYTEIRSVRGLDQIGKVTVYPNPTSNGTVNVVFDDASVVRTISVMDMSGRTLKQINNVSNNNITIDNLQPGMYTLRIMVPSTGEQTVQKIVVNKR